MKMRRWKKVGIVAAVLAALTTAAFVIAAPKAAAAICPVCYGFEGIDSGVYVDRSLSPDARAKLAEMLAEARARVRNFYKSTNASPRILVCGSEECFRRIGGGKARGVALLDYALLLSPRGANATIAAHELAHIELHHRLGMTLTVNKAVPSWFDEGLAVYVANDPRYLAPEGKADRCLIKPTAALPTGFADWRREASKDHELYAQAACQVSRWLDGHGGPLAVVRMIDEIKAGIPFVTASR